MITIQSILNNVSNITFFKASSFHGDKKYDIETIDDKTYFKVTTDRGVAYYKLNGSVIGNYTNLCKKLITKENEQIKIDLVDKADEINNFADCDVIHECRNEMYKSIFVHEMKPNATALINACIYRVGMDDKRVKYMISRMNEIIKQ